jgi:decaprenylphospho-beta-D-ribofuranose 2-oxidase
MAVARGAGLSFCGASFGSECLSVDMTAFDRVLDYDSESGLVRVEAGIRLAPLLEFLLRHGRTLTTVPGYGSITVGGCIAADVHGKNPARDGSFIRLVAGLSLFHPAHGVVEIAQDREAELFRATCGGFGLTGIIVQATLRTQALAATGVEISVSAVQDPASAGDLLVELSAAGDFAHAWLDFARPAHGFGRGHVTLGRLVAGGAYEPGALLPPGRGWGRVGALPVCLMNGWTLRAINAVYARRNGRAGVVRREDFAASMFPIHGNELYFRLFGRRGFHEYQALLPRTALPHYVERLRAATARLGACVTLGIAKLFDGQADLLRFDGRGVSLAIELRRDRNSPAFLALLDEALMEAGGRPNLIKDSRLPRRVFEATCPEADRFRAIRAAWDRPLVFRSELSERLGL